MGCDIHPYVEKRIESGWEVVPMRREFFMADKVIASADVRSSEYWNQWFEELVKTGEWIAWRNYRVFARLAGVRNYDDEIVPISPPRGLPEDVSAPVRAESDFWDIDGHSHSWLSLRELHDELLFSFSEDYARLVKEIAERTQDVSLDDVRLVFWFDN